MPTLSRADLIAPEIAPLHQLKFAPQALGETIDLSHLTHVDRLNLESGDRAFPYTELHFEAPLSEGWSEIHTLAHQPSYKQIAFTETNEDHQIKSRALKNGHTKRTEIQVLDENGKEIGKIIEKLENLDRLSTYSIYDGSGEKVARALRSLHPTEGIQIYFWNNQRQLIAAILEDRASLPAFSGEVALSWKILTPEPASPDDSAHTRPALDHRILRYLAAFQSRSDFRLLQDHTVRNISIAAVTIATAGAVAYAMYINEISPADVLNRANESVRHALRYVGILPPESIPAIPKDWADMTLGETFSFLGSQAHSYISPTVSWIAGGISSITGNIGISIAQGLANGIFSGVTNAVKSNPLYGAALIASTVIYRGGLWKTVQWMSGGPTFVTSWATYKVKDLIFKKKPETQHLVHTYTNSPPHAPPPPVAP